MIGRNAEEKVEGRPRKSPSRERSLPNNRAWKASFVSVAFPFRAYNAYSCPRASSFVYSRHVTMKENKTSYLLRLTQSTYERLWPTYRSFRVFFSYRLGLSSERSLLSIAIISCPGSCFLEKVLQVGITWVKTGDDPFCIASGKNARRKDDDQSIHRRKCVSRLLGAERYDDKGKDDIMLAG